MPVFNIIFFALYFRVLGGVFTKKGTDENLISRYISLPVGFAVLALQFYDDPLQLVAWCAVFYVIRLQETVPLLDASNQDKAEKERRKGIRDSVVRNLWILPCLPFTSWLLVLFLAQGGLYYVVGKYRDRFYPNTNPTAVSELISGGIFGAVL